MKKFLFLSAIVIAVIMSACSNEDYKSYVPADSKVVAKGTPKELRDSKDPYLVALKSASVLEEIK